MSKPSDPRHLPPDGSSRTVDLAPVAAGMAELDRAATDAVAEQRLGRSGHSTNAIASGVR